MGEGFRLRLVAGEVLCSQGGQGQPVRCAKKEAGVDAGQGEGEAKVQVNVKVEAGTARI